MSKSSSPEGGLIKTKEEQSKSSSESSAAPDRKKPKNTNSSPESKRGPSSKSSSPESVGAMSISESSRLGNESSAEISQDSESAEEESLGLPSLKKITSPTTLDDSGLGADASKEFLPITTPQSAPPRIKSSKAKQAPTIFYKIKDEEIIFMVSYTRPPTIHGSKQGDHVTAFSILAELIYNAAWHKNNPEEIVETLKRISRAIFKEKGVRPLHEKLDAFLQDFQGGGHFVAQKEGRDVRKLLESAPALLDIMKKLLEESKPELSEEQKACISHLKTIAEGEKDQQISQKVRTTFRENRFRVIGDFVCNLLNTFINSLNSDKKMSFVSDRSKNKESSNSDCIKVALYTLRLLNLLCKHDSDEIKREEIKALVIEQIDERYSQLKRGLANLASEIFKKEAVDDFRRDECAQLFGTNFFTGKILDDKIIDLMAREINNLFDFKYCAGRQNDDLRDLIAMHVMIVVTAYEDIGKFLQKTPDTFGKLLLSCTKEIVEKQGWGHAVKKPDLLAKSIGKIIDFKNFRIHNDCAISLNPLRKLEKGVSGQSDSEDEARDRDDKTSGRAEKPSSKPLDKKQEFKAHK